MNPVLKFFGSKWRLAPWVIRHLPPHSVYVEPFGGSAAVLLQKQPSYLEIYNDLDDGLVEFFRLLRDNPFCLIRAITLTPFSRREMEIARMRALDPLERARRLYVLAWQGRGGERAGTGGRPSWLYQRNAKRGGRNVDYWTRTEHLWLAAERLRHVQIECDDALDVIARYDSPETLFYLDPPYPHHTRGSHPVSYAHEYSDDDHHRLADILHTIAGAAAISSYPSPLYDELYSDWERIQTRARTQSHETRTEVLYISPRAANAGRLL